MDTVSAMSETITPPIVEPTTGMRSRMKTSRPSSAGYGIPQASIQKKVPAPAMNDVITLPST